MKHTIHRCTDDVAPARRAEKPYDDVNIMVYCQGCSATAQCCFEGLEMSPLISFDALFISLLQGYERW